MALLISFDPGIHGFLQDAWNARASVTQQRDLAAAKSWLYRKLYSQEAQMEPSQQEFQFFLFWLKAIAGNRRTTVQDMWIEDGGEQQKLELASISAEELVADLEPDQRLFTVNKKGESVFIEGKADFVEKLGKTFFHIHGNGAGHSSKRLYVNAKGMDSGLWILRKISESLNEPGFVEVKIVGPRGSNRPDPIVAYFATEIARRTVLSRLLAFQKDNEHLFQPTLPGLVHVEAPGIGSADEPPKFQVAPHVPKRLSFGEFLCTLVAMALRNLPAENPVMAHFLDNLLYSFRMLGVDPMHAQLFPDTAKLESLQAADDRSHVR